MVVKVVVCVWCVWSRDALAYGIMRPPICNLQSAIWVITGAHGICTSGSVLTLREKPR